MADPAGQGIPQARILVSPIASGDTDLHPFAITALLPHMTDYHAVYAVEIQSLQPYYRLLAPDQYCSAERALWQHSFLGC